MTNDDFLASLRSDWRRQSINVDGLAVLVEARRRRARLFVALNVVTVIALAALALWFAITAMRDGNSLYWVAAITFLLGAPAGLFEILESRRAGRLQFETSPAGMLDMARAQAQAARIQLRSFRWSALLLAGAALAAWGLARAGLADHGNVLFISMIWAAAAVTSWLWQYWRDRRLVAEIAGYDAVLASVAEAEDHGA